MGTRDFGTESGVVQADVLCRRMTLNPTPLGIGALVVSLEHTGLGIGKVARVGAMTVAVEYFDSVAEPAAQRVEVPPNRLVSAHLDRQLRVYFRQGSKWRVGRVIDDEFGRVRVRPPGDAEDLWLAEEDLFVRWDRPLVDPLGPMQARAMETPHHYFARRAFVDALLEQDAAARGNRALTSSAIEIYDHQIAVATRVLTDPVRRYLLADEVGMGKTIEAGLVIRQHLLDHPEAVVRVVAPTRMCHQWERELRTRFFVDDALLSTVDVVPTLDDMAWHVSEDRPGPELLVIDEAHHVARWADGSAGDRKRFASAARAAHAAPALLLLSATPVAHHEETFLAMLHLLDPHNYGLDDVEHLRRRVENRHDLAQAFVLFRPGQSFRRMTRREPHLRQLLEGDPESLARLDNLMAAGPDAAQEDLDRRIRTLRVAISDRQRIHYRMLRNRRDDSLDYPVRGRRLERSLDCGTPKESADLAAWLDRWRNALVADSGGGEEFPWEPVAQVMLERALAFPHVLIAATRRRLGARFPGDAEIVGRDDEIFDDHPPGPEERAALEELLDLNLAPIEEGRLQAISDFVWAIPRRRKMVVFSSFSATANRAADVLVELLAPGQVALHLGNRPVAESEAALGRFRDVRECNVLVCDASAEEGLNLQFADLIVHLDVPWDPNRLEQRIGRLDRHGPDTPVDNVLLGDGLPGSYNDAWIQALREGFQVFQRSISAFQYVVDALRPELVKALVEDGPDGMERLAATIPDRLERDREEIAVQDQMDSIEAIELNHPVAEAIRDLDDRWDEFEADHQGLICDGKGHLRFTRIPHFSDPSLCSYWSTDPVRGGEPLIPTRDMTAFMLGALSEKGDVRNGSHERAAVLSHPGARIWRTGDPFLDGLLRYTRERDDRGRAYGLWRVASELAEGEVVAALRFDILLRAGDTRAYDSSGDATAVMQRRAYGLLPPLVETVWVAPDISELADARIVSRMRAKYSPSFGDARLGQDRWDAVERALPGVDWEVWCADARRYAEETVRARTSLLDRVRTAEAHATRAGLARVEALRTRLLANPDLEAALRFEEHAAVAILEAVQNPCAVVDAMGLVILAPYALGGRP